ncbi:MAG: ABC transporter permease [Devosia nanyangense]|uniref:ABC transporter permease n=1 Tax=Devosia nanyangense TaxID=1228055 RepID=A0A933KZN7_9HYPH|nr:ABC transporter permease [Devosia nanyangense]
MLYETLKLALTAIRRNVLRSVLTLLGVTIGVAAVIAMVTLGQGTTQSVSGSISSLGSNLLVVQPGQVGQNASAGGMAAFRIADADAIERQVGAISAIAPVAIRSLTAVAGSVNHFVTVTGIDDGFLDVRQWAVAEGRNFREGELVSGAASCILGKAAADALYGTADPLDQTLRLKKLVCKVVGVLVEKGSGSFGSNQDDIILMPLHTFQRRISGSADVSAIYVAAESEAAIVRVQADVTALLRERRHLSASEDNDFTVMDMRQISSMLGSVMGILTGLLAAVASISLLVGGIGIMNIMLVSVTERTREIGIRLAIGARETQVLSQFLVEAVALSMLGGVAGIILGLGVAYGGAILLGVPFVFDATSILLAFGFSAVVGVGFGYFPARGAARLDPIEALRHE